MTTKLSSHRLEPDATSTKPLMSADSVQCVECLARALDVRSVVRNGRSRTRVKVRVERRTEFDWSALVLCLLTAVSCMHFVSAVASRRQKSMVTSEAVSIYSDQPRASGP